METARERIVEPANSKETNGPRLQRSKWMVLKLRLNWAMFWLLSPFIISSSASSLPTACFDVLFCTVFSMCLGTYAHRAAVDHMSAWRSRSGLVSHVLLRHKY